jgi:N-acetylglucosaminyldiphosphoundecaprenol N-acetyl-beta-D-mannosaminyltransferase
LRKLLIVLGVPIDDLDMPEALDRLEAFIAEGRATGRAHQVATVNTDFVVKALGDPELRLLLQETDMATADGMPLVWGARLLGVPLEGRVTGADLVPALAARAAEKGYSLYLLGAAPGVAAAAAEVLKAQHPNLIIAGICSPARSSVLDMDPAIVEAIRAAHPDVLLVAFGNPKQEKWIGMHAKELRVPVCIGVGGTLDFIAGKLRRAPTWMQKAGLEWVYRLLQEPRRLWKRYVVDMGSFGYFFVRQWWAMRNKPAPRAALPGADVLLVADCAILRVVGRLDVASQVAFEAHSEDALAELRRRGVPPHLVADLGRATFLDSSALGTLVALSKQARDAGGDLLLAAVPDAVARVLALTRLDRFLEAVPTVDAALKRGAMPSVPARPASDGPHDAAGWATLAAPRRLDAETAPEVIRQGLACLETAPRLILDLTGTAFLTSAGIAAIVGLDRRAKGLGGALRLAGCQPDVRRVLALSQIDRVVAVFDSVSAAQHS